MLTVCIGLGDEAAFVSLCLCGSNYPFKTINKHHYV